MVTADTVWDTLALAIDSVYIVAGVWLIVMSHQSLRDSKQEERLATEKRDDEAYDVASTFTSIERLRIGYATAMTVLSLWFFAVILRYETTWRTIIFLVIIGFLFMIDFRKGFLSRRLRERLSGRRRKAREQIRNDPTGK